MTDFNTAISSGYDRTGDALFVLLYLPYAVYLHHQKAFEGVLNGIMTPLGYWGTSIGWIVLLLLVFFLTRGLLTRTNGTNTILHYLNNVMTPATGRLVQASNDFMRITAEHDVAYIAPGAVLIMSIAMFWPALMCAAVQFIIYNHFLFISSGLSLDGKVPIPTHVYVMAGLTLIVGFMLMFTIGIHIVRYVTFALVGLMFLAIAFFLYTSTMTYLGRWAVYHHISHFNF